MSIDTSLRKVLVIGSGPIVIGQAAEFDYSGSQACRSLREEGLEVVLINSNPATIMTDPETADRVYIEPLTVEFAERVIAQERPDGLLPTLGGQTGLNLATELAVRGILDKYGVRLLGTPLTAIQAAEDREKFRDLMRQIGEPVPESWIVESIGELRRVAEIAPYPCIVRPAYTLGGTGGGIARTPDELLEIGARGLDLSMRHQIMVERSLLGWKEIEYEVMRDGADNAIVVCNMENLDPMGVHTGDSMVVAPSQTLSDFEYQLLRTASLRIIRALGIQGGCNVQLALNPNGSDYYVIEVNPRVSRSSALASKATGYPIARIAAKIAIGLHLDEIRNPITGTSAAFEPALDYCVVKLPRFPFDKFPTGDRTLGTQMKATGEVMAIDRTFEGALMKAVRGLEVGVSDLRYPPAARLSPMELETLIATPNDMRLFYIAEAFRRGWLVEEVHALSKVDPWFLHKIKHLVEIEGELTARSEELRDVLSVASASSPTSSFFVASASPPTDSTPVASASPPTSHSSVASASPPTMTTPYFPTFREIAQIFGSRLPHWVAENTVYFITFRLADSLPREVLQKYLHERNALLKRERKSDRPLTRKERQQIRWLLSERFDDLLHAEHGSCVLAERNNAQIVSSALQHFHLQRYILWAWCVMPNHVHAVVQPLPNHSLSQILHTWKSYTSHQLVKHKAARAPVWERDYFQRLIRNQQEFERAIIYTLLNPEWTELRYNVGVPADEPRPRSVGVPADEPHGARSVGVPADELSSALRIPSFRAGIPRGWWDAAAGVLREEMPEWLAAWFVGGTPPLRGEIVGEDADATGTFVGGTPTLRGGTVGGTPTLRGEVVGEDADATGALVGEDADATGAFVGEDADATIQLLRRAKEWQFSDKFLSQITGLSEAQVRAGRKALGILPAFKMVDTCAGEFEARTPYFYSTYHGVSDRPAPQHSRKALVLGSGPIRIGQGIEFDYSAVHAVKTLRALGYYAIILNNNPETVSTDFDISDALYFDPITTEDVLNVLEYESNLIPPSSLSARGEGGVSPSLFMERKSGDEVSIPVLVQFGGQTAINLVKSLQVFGVKLLGTPPESIDIAEDRRQFDALLEELGIPRPPGRAVLTLEDALETAHRVGYPVLVRPSYVLGGRAMEIVRTDAELETYWHSAVLAFPDAPVLVDKYIEGREAEVDLIGDGENFIIPAIMEHIERAGVHSGDSMTVVPPQTLSESEQAQIRDYALRLAKALRVCGLVNMQFVVQDGKVYVIEVNPRASRTVPYLSKITNVPMVKLAVAAQVGSPSAFTESGQENEVPRIAVKAPVFSSLKLKQVEVALGPEMRSTGEVMGIDRTYAAALYKAMVAAGIRIPRSGNVLLTLADKDKAEGVALARAFHEKGFQLYATEGTARALREAGLPVQVAPKIGQGKPDLLNYITGKRVQLLVNTPSPERRAEQQGLIIRRAAVETGIPCLTALDTAWALLHALEAGEFEVAPIGGLNQ